MLRQFALVVAAFAVATLLAELLGAANLGVAMTFGQVAVVATATWLILRGARPG